MVQAAFIEHVDCVPRRRKQWRRDTVAGNAALPLDTALDARRGSALAQRLYWARGSAHIDKGAILLALPTEAQQLAKINDLVPCLGNTGPVDLQRLSRARPKQSRDDSGPPEKNCPAAAATADRAKTTYRYTLQSLDSTGSGVSLVVSDQLRKLANAVRRIGGRDPEAIAISKDEVAAELVRLARLLGSGR